MIDIKSRRSVTEDGAMELPFKLMVMIVLVAVVVPVSMVGYRNVSRSSFQHHIQGELNRLMDLAGILIREGNLSSEYIDLDLSGNIFAGLDSVRLGDSLGGNTRWIEYRMNWRTDPGYLVTEKGVHLSSAVNCSMVLRGGEYRLQLTCLHIDHETTVIVISHQGRHIDFDSFRPR